MTLLNGMMGEQLNDDWPKTLPEWWQNAARSLGDQMVIVDDNVAGPGHNYWLRASAWAATWEDVLPGDRILIIGNNSLVTSSLNWRRGCEVRWLFQWRLFTKE